MQTAYASRFESLPTLSQLGEDKWKLFLELAYNSKDGTRYVVPAGFVTDLASVPRPLRWLVSPTGKYAAAAILHDYLMTRPDISTDRADAIFREAMEDLHVDYLRTWMMWAAVRLAHRLYGSSASEFLVWLLVAVPSILFVAVPGFVNVVFLAIFWAASGVVHLIRTAFDKQSHPPSFWLAADATNACKDDRKLRK